MKIDWKNKREYYTEGGPECITGRTEIKNAKKKNKKKD
jgi:hypothetical protein